MYVFYNAIENWKAQAIQLMLAQVMKWVRLNQLPIFDMEIKLKQNLVFHLKL